MLFKIAGVRVFFNFDSLYISFFMSYFLFIRKNIILRNIVNRKNIEQNDDRLLKSVAFIIF